MSELRITPQEYARIDTALARLGRRRCRSALTAFEQPRDGWRTCPLAMAYGPVGKLANRLCDVVHKRELTARLLHLDLEQVDLITRVFDDGSPYQIAQLQRRFRATAGQ